MDALTLLTADHNRVRGLFTRFHEAKNSGDTTQLGELAEKIFFELKVHTDIEEKIFYPAVRDLDESLSDEVEEGLQEHHVVDMLITEAQDLQPGEDSWLAKMTVLIENVEHHAAEEEQDLFPAVRSKSDAETRQQWGARLEAMKAKHGAPTSEAAAKLSTTELRQLSREQRIPNRSKMSREELIATVDPS
jgi:hemerythrin superfamily protein